MYRLESNSDIEKQKFESYLNKAYGLNMSDTTDKHIKKELIHHSRNIAEEVEIHK